MAKLKVEELAAAKQARQQALHRTENPELIGVRKELGTLQRHQIQQAAARAARTTLEDGAPGAAARVLEQIEHLAEHAKFREPGDPMFDGVSEEHRKIRLATGWNKNALTASRVLHGYVGDVLDHVMGRAVQSHRIESQDPQLSELGQAFLGFGAGFLTELRRMLVEEARGERREVEQIEAETE